jgi:peptide deformylase
MPIRPLLELGNPLLRQFAQPVDDVASAETVAIITDLWDTLYHFRAEHGWGRSLAAPLIGASRRIIIVNEQGQEWTLINPRLARWSREQAVDFESCVAVGSLWGLVSRSQQIVVTALDVKGQEQRYEAEGLLARILQHELDHLDGLMWLDREPDIASICTTNEYRRRYKNRD